ncbi:M56 family metallopeptidase [Myxococcota bacterium]|nr:M56 family metallopeptidase [Myxococcota bacterium]
MTAHLASLAALAGLWLMLSLATALAASLLARPLQRALRTGDPERRARLAWLVAAAPVTLPSSLVLLCALPGLVGAFLGVGDHCTAHADHSHFCLIHATVAMSPVAGVTLALFAAIVLRALRSGAASVRSGLREARWLTQRRMRALAPGVHLIDAPEPIALTHGLGSPEIWISQGLHTALAEEERAVVLAHERAHARRRDSARLLLAGVAATLHRSAVRDLLLRELRLAIEQICDASAAREVGDPLRVAHTLLRVERLMRGSRSLALHGAAALVDTSLPARVEALLAPPEQTRRAPRRAPIGWVFLVAALLLASPLHHLVEHVFEAVVRSMVGVGHLL